MRVPLSSKGRGGRHATAMAVAVSVLLLCSCAETSPNWDAQFGSGVVAARASQVLDPSAPSRGPSTAVADGKAVAGAMKNYGESYGYAVKAAPQPALAIQTSASGR